MIQKISAPVTVMLVFDHQKRTVVPKRIRWDGKTYDIIRIGLHHTYREGRTLIHVFSVESDTLAFRLACNSETLHWRLEEISDGEPD